MEYNCKFIMARNVNHLLLDNAKINKKDEFYTQLCDIERELQHYKKHFKNKVVLCNCDDFKVSKFFQYFVMNFKTLGIKKVICSCYNNQTNGYYYEYNGNQISSNNIKYLKGNGDFRNIENIELLQQADIVVTNPPFSLFREYVAQLINFNKKFLIISNINAITYKEIFNLIKDNRVWLGINLGRGISGFVVPDYYQLYGLETKVNEQGEKIVSPNNCMWLTNLDNQKRQEFIPLTKRYFGNEFEYPKYDNYDGINVDKTKNIPADYSGAMGVPITFLHRFNPRQFEIIKFRKGNDEKDLRINGKATYFRILIKNKLLNKDFKITNIVEYKQQKLNFGSVSSAKQVPFT